MKKLIKLFVHCTDTPEQRIVTKEDLEHWHMAPLNLPDGKVQYLGKIYPNRDLLPAHKIKNTLVKQLFGRGWDRYGYSDMIARDGSIINITPYNDDDVVDKDEMTWGVSGHNSNARHVVLVGGKGGKRSDDFFVNFTEEQYLTTREYLHRFVHNNPDRQILAHYNTSARNCPGFDLLKFLKQVNLEQSYGGK
jgi:N-acetylmuramoyl-L-alanine amidase